MRSRSRYESGAAKRLTMDYALSQHALRRMLEDEITETMIDEVLLRPTWTPATTRGTRYDGILADGRRLCVVLDEDRNPPLVATVFWFGQRRR